MDYLSRGDLLVTVNPDDPAVFGTNVIYDYFETVRGQRLAL